MDREKLTNKHRVHRGPVYLISFLIIVYIMLYEWGVFEADILHQAVSAAKIIIPLLLLVLIPVRKSDSKAFRLFILFYLCFMIWALAPGIFAAEFQDTLLTWLKYSPRFLFVFLVGLYFLRQSEASINVMKLLVVVGVLTVIQFFLLVPAVLFDVAAGFYIAGVRGMYFGPYGILGNQVAVMSFPGLRFPVFRLTGFWLEPTNASGFLFAAFFLARVIHGVEKKLYWRIMGYLCLAGGFFALSNAGYLAIATPILFACLFMKKSGGKIVYVILLTSLALGLAYFAIQGRSLVAQQYGGSTALRALSGQREGTEVDPYGGRVQLLQKNLDLVISNPFGIGMRVSGEGTEGSYEEASASAPILWLAYTGFIGLVLLLLREYQVMLMAVKYSRESGLVMGASQAWIALFVQHLIGGTWMTPMYLVLCALVISTVFHTRRISYADHFSAA